MIQQSPLSAMTTKVEKKEKNLEAFEA